MRAGFWQIVFVVTLALVFFHRPVIAVLRALMGGGSGEKGGGRATRGRASGGKCYKCGAPLPRGARFCHDCGRPQDVIDV